MRSESCTTNPSATCCSYTDGRIGCRLHYFDTTPRAWPKTTRGHRLWSDHERLDEVPPVHGNARSQTGSRYTEVALRDSVVARARKFESDQEGASAQFRLRSKGESGLEVTRSISQFSCTRNH